MTNFDFLKDDPQFSGFADAAIAAERILPIDAATAVLDCRRAMESAVKWMYSVDGSLVKPWDDKLVSLMSTEEFHDIVDDDLWRRMDFIRKRGNDAAHGSRSISREQAELCLENLFLFLDFVAYCYGTSYQEKKFDASLLTQQPAAPVAQPALPDVDLDALIKENAEAKRTKVQKNDLLISITADLGRTGVVTEEIANHGAYINQHLTCIRLKDEQVNPLYVAYYMESDAGKEQFTSKNQSAVKAGLNFNAINSLKLMVPPLSLQNQFAAFVEEVDKSKLFAELFAQNACILAENRSK